VHALSSASTWRCTRRGQHHCVLCAMLQHTLLLLLRLLLLLLLEILPCCQQSLSLCCILHTQLQEALVRQLQQLLARVSLQDTSQRRTQQSCTVNAGKPMPSTHIADPIAQGQLLTCRAAAAVGPSPSPAAHDCTSVCVQPSSTGGSLADTDAEDGSESNCWKCCTASCFGCSGTVPDTETGTMLVALSASSGRAGLLKQAPISHALGSKHVKYVYAYRHQCRQTIQSITLFKLFRTTGLSL
jgi:hypothetical protein